MKRRAGKNRIEYNNENGIVTLIKSPNLKYTSKVASKSITTEPKVVIAPPMILTDISAKARFVRVALSFAFTET